MSRENLNVIRSNYYWLLKKGFTLDELKNLEPHEFQFYIRQVQEEYEAEKERMKKRS
jgi:hypothetical protein